MEVAMFVEDIVCGKQRLGDRCHALPIVQQDGCVLQRLACGGCAARRCAEQDADVGRCLARNVVDQGIDRLDEIAILKQVKRRITGDAQLRKNDQVCTVLMCSMHILEHDVGIMTQVSDYRIDLSKREFHGGKTTVNCRKMASRKL